MNLRTYLDTLPRGGITDFSDKVGINPVYMSQLAAKQDGRVPSPELCLLLCDASNNKITRQDLRPDDYHLIWPDLRKFKRATDKAVSHV